MAKATNPSPALLRQLLRYEPDTGKLFWRERPTSMFEGSTYAASRLAASWNARCAGQEAFKAIGSHGYPSGKIGNRGFLAHRVIWAIVTGCWPEDEIDHRDGCRTNNRFANLSPSSHAGNLKNAAGKKGVNRSGVTGVAWRSDRLKWRARIMLGGRDIFLGHFDDFNEAVAAREAALVRYGFSERHGTLQ